MPLTGPECETTGACAVGALAMCTVCTVTLLGCTWTWVDGDMPFYYFTTEMLSSFPVRWYRTSWMRENLQWLENVVQMLLKKYISNMPHGDTVTSILHFRNYLLILSLVFCSEYDM